ncbi:transporter substrate-binding domain-containing protein [Paenibacillus rhizovicinus]|uniref:Transporter substrate-binding domain-containing protein n=1 Tax=Paenibacillus rhizovicinus TaxID=2704463 RepID=A0A6C0P567_9BACL|nr:transporter substrate-binding domain-containing protein [Paenibacillus rhizovicinus]QHW31792.1 transporter substrate-binding domain-containing protein [Paenibacillus rhizovicinus]
MRKSKAIAAFGITMALAAGVLSGCGSSSSNDSGSNAANDASSAGNAGSAKEKTIYVGTQNDYPPFAFVDDKNELTGYDVEVLKEVDKKLDGYKIEFTPTTWDSIFLALESNKIQLIADEVARSAEREEKYLFSDESYFAAQTVIIVKKGRTDIQTLKDLEGKNVGAVAGDSYTQILEEYNKSHDKKINLKYTDSTSPADVLQQVQNGRIDAYVNDPVMMKATIKKQNFDLDIVGDPIQADNIGIVFNKDKQGEDLKALIDPILKGLKDDGTLAKLSQKWTEGEYIPQ